MEVHVYSESKSGWLPLRLTTALLCALACAGSPAETPKAAPSAVAAQTRASQSAITPAHALELLKQGNARFVAGAPLRRDLLAQMHATAAGQFPFASIVGCIDSRVPPELVFDQGLGDVFSARIAGNFVDDEILGSLEFASKVAGSRLIVVLGHTQCGAIKGACDGVQFGNLTTTLSHLAPAVDAVKDVPGPRSSKNAIFVGAVTDMNVRLTVAAIRERSPVLDALAKSGELAIVGAIYDVATGAVTFLD
jgi:carbonic anhydrase